MILAIGDLHLSDSREWSYKVSSRVVDYLISIAKPLDTIVFLGDFTEDTFLTGRLFALLQKLFYSLLCVTRQNIYVLVGNHDLREDKNNNPSLTLEFLRHSIYQKAIIIEEPVYVTIEEYKCLFLPWINPDGTRSVKDYERGGDSCDILFGHFQDSTSNMPGGAKVDLSKYSVKYVCLGHIHNPPNDRYIGALIPNKVDEGNRQRFIWYFDGAGKHVVAAPNIIDYYSVKFPEPLPEVPAEIPIWTVYNCKDEAIAKQQYGDIYIRKAIYDISVDSEALDIIRGSLSNKKEEPIFEMFKKWLTELELEPELKTLALSYFKGN